MNKSDLLSNEEMSALLPDPETTASEKRNRVVPYNFRRPDRLSKEQVRGLYLLHDLYANSLSSSLPLFLRTFCEVNLISVEQQSYSEYIKGLPDPTTMFTVSALSMRSVFAVEMNSTIAFPIIDRMLGGEGKELKEQRAATELELKILEGFIGTLVEGYREVWKPVVDMTTEFNGRETRPNLLQIVASNEVVAAVVYQIQVGDVRGTMSICLPVAMLETVIDKFNQSAYSTTKPTAPEATAALLKTLSTVNFPVSAELDKIRAAVSDLMTLSEGDILRTNHRVEKPVNISVGVNEKFVGRLAALESRIVVQITEPEKTAQAAA